MRKFVLFSLFPLLFLSSLGFAAPSEKNEAVVKDFYEKAINQKDFEAASVHFGNYYIQHNPNVEDGMEGFKKLIDFLRNNYPQAHSEIKKVFSDGDYVFIHVHSIREPDTRGRAIFDLFRLENGKIVEHWDTVQDIPEISANPNGMF